MPERALVVGHFVDPIKLSRFTDIGLRSLMYLGAHTGRAVSTSEMATALQVSKDHLMKSLSALADFGLVEASRGRTGGFALARGRQSFRLGTVVRALEPTSPLAECFGPDSTGRLLATVAWHMCSARPMRASSKSWTARPWPIC
jgi:Rrf2 family nitric oxide-sensitive transcriptional repressor